MQQSRDGVPTAGWKRNHSRVEEQNEKEMDNKRAFSTTRVGRCSARSSSPCAYSLPS